LIDAAIKHAKAKGGDIDAQANAALDRLVRIKSLSVELIGLISSSVLTYQARRIRQRDFSYHSWTSLDRSRRPPLL
jgi:hypothetical protein